MPFLKFMPNMIMTKTTEMNLWVPVEFTRMINWVSQSEDTDCMARMNSV